MPARYQRRLELADADLWATIDEHTEDEFFDLIDALIAELPEGHPVALAVWTPCSRKAGRPT